MDIEQLLEKLKSIKKPLRTKLNGIRFKGEEQGRFRFKHNHYQKYAGDCLINETPTSFYLDNAIFYANERASQRRYIEKNGHLDILPILGFPLVMAIDISRYKTKPGIEPDEEVITGEIEKKDIFVLFDDKVDFLNDIIHPSWYATLIFQQKQARKTESIKSEIKRLKTLISS